MIKKLKTIKVQGGQEYVMVKDRVLYFNETYPKGMITTELVKNDAESVIFKATIYPDATDVARHFTGYSEAYAQAKGVEGQKPVEVAETSAIGRALAAMGIGVLESYASADEVAMASKFGRKALDGEFPNRFGAQAATMKAKPASEKQKELIMNMALDRTVEVKREDLDKMDSWQASQKINELKKAPFPQKTNSQVKAEDSWEQEFNEEPVIKPEDVPF